MRKTNPQKSKIQRRWKRKEKRKGERKSRKKNGTNRKNQRNSKYISHYDHCKFNKLPNSKIKIVMLNKTMEKPKIKIQSRKKRRGTEGLSNMGTEQESWARTQATWLRAFILLQDTTYYL